MTAEIQIKVEIRNLGRESIREKSKGTKYLYFKTVNRLYENATSNINFIASCPVPPVIVSVPRNTPIITITEKTTIAYRLQSFLKCLILSTQLPILH
jgi:hypothetical protein